MGIVFVLGFWAIAGTVIAACGAAVLGRTTDRLTEGVQNGRRTLITAATLFPFVWWAPLPNGYEVMMIDVTDQGCVYNPKTQPGSGVSEREDAIFGVRKLQVAGRFLIGATDSQTVDEVAGYFIMDTGSGKQEQFNSDESLSSRARELGMELNLQPIHSVYSKFRFSWFDISSGILLVLPPLAGFYH